VTWSENPDNLEHPVPTGNSGPSDVDAFRQKYDKASGLGVGLGVAVLLFGAVPFAWCLANGWFVGYCIPVMIIGLSIIGHAMSR
jgi:hypothetical protein